MVNINVSRESQGILDAIVTLVGSKFSKPISRTYACQIAVTLAGRALDELDPAVIHQVLEEAMAQRPRRGMPSFDTLEETNPKGLLAYLTEEKAKMERLWPDFCVCNVKNPRHCKLHKHDLRIKRLQARVKLLSSSHGDQAREGQTPSGS